MLCLHMLTDEISRFREQPEKTCRWYRGIIVKIVMIVLRKTWLQHASTSQYVNSGSFRLKQELFVTPWRTNEKMHWSCEVPGAGPIPFARQNGTCLPLLWRKADIQQDHIWYRVLEGFLFHKVWPTYSVRKFPRAGSWKLSEAKSLGFLMPVSQRQWLKRLPDLPGQILLCKHPLLATGDNEGETFTDLLLWELEKCNITNKRDHDMIYHIKPALR